MNDMAIRPIELFRPLSKTWQIAAQQDLGDTEAATAIKDRVSLRTLVNVPPVKRVEYRNSDFESSGGGTDFNSDSKSESAKTTLAVGEQGSQQPRKINRTSNEPEVISFGQDGNDIFSFGKPEQKSKMAIGKGSLLKSPIEEGYFLAA